MSVVADEELRLVSESGCAPTLTSKGDSNGKELEGSSPVGVDSSSLTVQNVYEPWWAGILREARDDARAYNGIRETILHAFVRRDCRGGRA